MKKSLALLTFLSLLASCQQDKKDAGVVSTGASVDKGVSVAIPSEVSHCKWSPDGLSGFDRTSQHLGDYSFCKSKTSDDVYLQVKDIPETQICVIPTSSNANVSVYIGEPRCLQVLSSKQIYKISILKNRPGFESFPLTGAMLLKDMVLYTYGAPYTKPYYAVDAYLECFRMLNQNDPSYCKAFNAKGEHVLHQF